MRLKKLFEIRRRAISAVDVGVPTEKWKAHVHALSYRAIFEADSTCADCQERWSDIEYEDIVEAVQLGKINSEEDYWAAIENGKCWKAKQIAKMIPNLIQQP